MTKNQKTFLTIGLIGVGGYVVYRYAFMKPKPVATATPATTGAMTSADGSKFYGASGKDEKKHHYAEGTNRIWNNMTNWSPADGTIWHAATGWEFGNKH